MSAVQPDQTIIENAVSPGGRKVVVVDLDRTLSRSDTLHEQAIKMIFQRPQLLPGLFLALLRGKKAVKAYCATHIALDPALLLMCEEVLAYLRDEQRQGSYLVLCSAADRRVAELVASAVGLFDEVLATGEGANLKGAAKANLLVQRFPHGFVYAGDHAADLAVWAKSDGIVLVGTSPATTRRAQALGKPVLAELRPHRAQPPVWRVWGKALRVHQSAKNVLMFVPLLLAHEWSNGKLVAETVAGFLLLVVVTSSSYLVNDLADLESDRRHATKRHRPIASGVLPLAHAAIFPALMVPVALVLAFVLNVWFGLALAGYLALTSAYSFGLKRVPIFDVFVVATLFTSRLAMGAAFIGQLLPIWLITFSMFFFFSLAMAKRHTEVLRAGQHGGSLKARGYEPEDWPLTLNLGVSSGLGSLIILVLYLFNEAFRSVGYSRPDFLWPVVLCVALWISRIWLLTHRGRMNDDPVVFALRDRPSWAVAAVVVLCYALAL
ncbi:MAG: UbiA family prenyltransferase [Devosia sp.]|nr:UbiA family prenyltransferase [Devosia sp.]